MAPAERGPTEVTAVACKANPTKALNFVWRGPFGRPRAVGYNRPYLAKGFHRRGRIGRRGLRPYRLSEQTSLG